jgi:hypothetical protein
VFDHRTVALVLYIVIMSAALRADVTIHSCMYQVLSRSDRLDWTQEKCDKL